MHRLFPVLLSAILLFPQPILAASQPDPIGSTIGIDKTTVKADGIDSARIAVTLKDRSWLPIKDVAVTLVSSRGAQDEVVAEKATTDSLGKARFLVRSLRNGTATFSARAGDIVLQKTVTITFQNGLSIPLSYGDLIKIPDDGDVLTLNDTAVYYYAIDGRRYVFPNEKVYYTWYPDFSRVKIIPIDQMSLIPIGGNITYRPGSKLVKFQTDAKTYLVTKGGVLRWAKTEDVARGWFGDGWNHMVDDISEAFYINYRFGEPYESALAAPLDLIRSSVNTIDEDRGLVSYRFP